jgi:ribonuclease HII
MSIVNQYGLKLWSERERLEVGLDECARGCLLGRTYMACVVWSNDFLEESIDDPEYDWLHEIRDSKKMTPSKREIISTYIKEYALDFNVQWADEKQIDKVNILNAVQAGFHRCLDNLQFLPEHIHVDGNIFRPYMDHEHNVVSYECIEGGDNALLSIASASILAKVEHDKYIAELCEKYPILTERYDISNNMGYGTSKHMNGINQHGITQFHRRSFGICKTASLQNI